MLALLLNSVIHMFDRVYYLFYFILFPLQIERFSCLRIIKTRKSLEKFRSRKKDKHNFKHANSVVRTLKERAEDSYCCRM